jgi:ABC-type sugar transport system substrate-binding protein
MRKGLVPVLIALLAVALVAAACGDDEGGTTTTAAASTTAAGGSKGTIGVSFPTIQGPFFTAILYGIESEAEALGYETVILDAGGYANVDEQISQVENLIAQGVDAILLDRADPAALADVIEQAQAAGIFVFGSGEPIPEADGSASSSHCDIGKALAHGAEVLLPDGGTMAALTGPAGAFWATDRWRCFKEALASNIEIVAEQTSEPDASVGLTLAADFLQRFPDVNLIYGADDTVGVGAAKAVQENNQCDQVSVLFNVFGEQAEELLSVGCADYIVAQQTVLIGRTAVQLADRFLSGNPAAEPFVTVPLVDITRDNMATIDVGTIRQPSGWTP